MLLNNWKIDVIVYYIETKNTLSCTLKQKRSGHYGQRKAIPAVV